MKRIWPRLRHERMGKMRVPGYLCPCPNCERKRSVRLDARKLRQAWFTAQERPLVENRKQELAQLLGSLQNMRQALHDSFREVTGSEPPGHNDPTIH